MEVRLGVLQWCCSSSSLSHRQRDRISLRLTHSGDHLVALKLPEKIALPITRRLLQQ